MNGDSFLLKDHTFQCLLWTEEVIIGSIRGFIQTSFVSILARGWQNAAL